MISRENIIVKTSVIGIVANVLLAAFKAVIGFMVNFIAIILDAVKNIFPKYCEAAYNMGKSLVL